MFLQFFFASSSGATHPGCHPLIRTHSVERSHCQGAQGHGDTGGCTGSLHCLLVPLLHLLHLHRLTVQDQPSHHNALRGAVAGLLQLSPEPHPVSSLQQGFPEGLRRAAPLQGADAEETAAGLRLCASTANIHQWEKGSQAA